MQGRDSVTDAALRYFSEPGPTTELETFYLWNKARNLSQFRKGLQKFDFGSQNWAYADRKGVGEPNGRGIECHIPRGRGR